MLQEVTQAPQLTQQQQQQPQVASLEQADVQQPQILATDQLDAQQIQEVLSSTELALNQHQIHLGQTNWRGQNTLSYTQNLIVDNSTNFCKYSLEKQL